jgi:hypothetical protein
MFVYKYINLSWKQKYATVHFAKTPFKGKVWSKMKLHRLVLCVKDWQSAIFVRAQKDFLT